MTETEVIELVKKTLIKNDIKLDIESSYQGEFLLIIEHKGKIVFENKCNSFDMINWDEHQ